MCGIAGIVSTQLTESSMATALIAMQKKLSHRGPDGDGIYRAPSQRAVIAHTRLAIIDLSSTGSQPMTSRDGRYTISFNGEIYNYKSLRDELCQQGSQFESNSDTEVILQLYSRQGSRCVSKLRGMYAFVIWDEHQQSAFAARDPFGIKPFYYWHNPNSLAFASELRSIIASGLSSQTLCSNGLEDYFKRGTVAEPNTIINDIKMLPAGHALTWNNGEISINSHAELIFASKVMTREQALKTTRAAIEDSIRAHLVSDVPVGLFLSGGVDSCVLLALATTISKTQINTYSIAFADPQWNEGDIAARVAKHFGANHTEFLMTAEKARRLFMQYLNIIDQPTIDGFNTFCVAQLASKHSEKVVLSGLGGDELFAGYRSFITLPKMMRLSRTVFIIAPLIRLMGRILNRFLSTRSRRAFDFLGQPGSLLAAYQSFRGIFSNSESNCLGKLYKVDNKQHRPINPSNHCEPTNTQTKLVNQISHLELTNYLRNQLLRDSDVASMACGLELRVPFIDKRLFDQIATIPAKWRLEYGKKILIDSVPELPEWVINRPKQGFSFPFDDWFCDAWLSDVASQEASSQKPSSKDEWQTNQNYAIELPEWIPLTPWYRRWNLIVLDHWLGRYTKQPSQH